MGKSKTRRYYDDAGRFVREQGPAVLQPDGATQSARFTAFEYYADGNVKDERRGVTSADPAGSLSTTTSSAPLEAQLAGDAIHRAALTVYDVVGRVKSVATTFVEPGGSRTVTESIARTFDGNGLLIETHTDAKQNITTTYYNALGLVASVSSIPVPLPKMPTAIGCRPRSRSSCITTTAGSSSGSRPTRQHRRTTRKLA